MFTAGHSDFRTDWACRALSWGSRESCRRAGQAPPVPNVLRAFDKRFQPGQGLIPLLRDLIEVSLEFFHGLRIEFKPALAARADVVHNFRFFQYAKMLGNGLPGQPGALGELRDRTRLPAAKRRNQQEPRLIA